MADIITNFTPGVNGDFSYPKTYFSIIYSN